MDLQYLREYCLRKHGVSEELPFDDTILVFKVANKIFLLTNLDLFEFINVKCDPELAVELREQYESVIPGYHMNKKHWNTVRMDAGLPAKLILQWVDHSYDMVVKGLSKKERESLAVS
jgi:predicted DNA-binding protein (MmcQ/YjbR family)